MYGDPSKPPSSSMAHTFETGGLPPELWALIFEHATSISRFFDARWHHRLLTPFDDAHLDARAAYESFALSMATKKAISLVCRGWHQFAAGLVYRHIVIRRTAQLSALVHLFESSRGIAKRLGAPTVGLGWWVTHIKLIAMDYGVATVEAQGQSHGDNTISISEGGNFLFYLRRLLACCPRLEVLLDAAPYATNDRPKSYLCAIPPSLASSTPCLHSLEYARSGPNLGDLLANPHISQNLRSLKCNNVHPPLTRDLSILIPAAHQILSLSNLVSLDLFLSSSTYKHWDIIAESLSLPSLTHFAFRVPPSSSNLLGLPARRSMRSFFLSHGPQLVSLDLKICPGDAPVDGWRDVDSIAQTTMLIPPILELCPNITELAISARWIAPHPHSPPPRSPSPSSIQAPAHRPKSYFQSWRHRDLVRIGLRDTHPCAPGFSTALANSPCGSSRSLAPSSLREDNHDSHPTAGMSRRLCSVHHFICALLSHSSTYDGTHDTTISSSAASHRRAFPVLASIYLLDSSPEMFFRNTPPEVGSHHEGRGQGASSSQHTRISNTGAGSSDPTFWSVWARHCATQGVVLYDWAGLPLPLGPIESLDTQGRH